MWFCPRFVFAVAVVCVCGAGRDVRGGRPEPGDCFQWGWMVGVDGVRVVRWMGNGGGGGGCEGASRTAHKGQGAVMATASFSGDRFKWRPCRGGAALCGGGHGHPVQCAVHVVGWGVCVCVERARLSVCDGGEGGGRLLLWESV